MKQPKMKRKLIIAWIVFIPFLLAHEPCKAQNYTTYITPSDTLLVDTVNDNIVYCQDSKETLVTCVKKNIKGYRNNDTVSVYPGANNLWIPYKRPDDLPVADYTKQPYMLKFANGKQIPIVGGVYYSPNGDKTGVLENYSTLRIYDKSANLVATHQTPKLEQMALADDGRFAVFGHDPGLATSLYGYDKNGKNIFTKERQYFAANGGSFSSQNNYFVFITQVYSDTTRKNIVKVIVFDKDYNVVNNHIFLNWFQHYGFYSVRLDEQHKEIRIFIAFGVYETKTDYRATLVYDLEFNLRRKELGWNLW